MTDGDQGNTDGGMLERLRNSPRTVSTIIVILIVLGAIFAFSDRGAKLEESPLPGETSTATAPTETPEGAETTSPEATKTPEATAKPSPSPLPEAQETDAAYVEVAARGEGVTHQARKAMLRYLESNKPDFDVTVEHKVWMEDYVKDRIGRKPLGVGQNLEVSKDLVREAVNEAKKLSDAQRKNLTRYAQRVAAYR